EEEEEEEKAFEQNLKSANDTLISEIQDQTTEKRHSSNTELKSIKDGNHNEQDNDNPDLTTKEHKKKSITNIFLLHGTMKIVSDSESPFYFGC
ncbi:16691_t:CDS:1, partial [Cetraspora pellucida]